MQSLIQTTTTKIGIGFFFVSDSLMAKWNQSGVGSVQLPGRMQSVWSTRRAEMKQRCQFRGFTLLPRAPLPHFDQSHSSGWWRRMRPTLAGWRAPRAGGCAGSAPGLRRVCARLDRQMALAIQSISNQDRKSIITIIMIIKIMITCDLHGWDWRWAPIRWRWWIERHRPLNTIANECNDGLIVNRRLRFLVLLFHFSITKIASRAKSDRWTLYLSLSLSLLEKRFGREDILANVSKKIPTKPRNPNEKSTKT